MSMKSLRRIWAVLLCLILSCGVFTGTAAATAGSTVDPLISLSYARETFYSEVRAAFSETARQVISEKLGVDASPSEKIMTLIPGESVSLSSGQQFILLSGAGNLTVESGNVVNVTVGYEAVTGNANLLHRYILCENSSVDLDVTAKSVVKISNGVRIGTGSPFGDVRRKDWFYADVVSAVGRGLVNGMTPSVYQPGGTLTVAQCVKLAACMHQLREDGAVTLKNTGQPWYAVYTEYAMEKGIIDALPEDYDAVINRADFVAMFYRALPEDDYTAINNIADGSIPDLPVSAETDHGAEIYSFYRAGILMGYTNDGRHALYAFGPEDNITRAEVAVIMNRMFDPSARRSFSIN